MITVHAYDKCGQRKVVVIDGTDRAEAREFCHALVGQGNGVYRAAIFDRMSQRYSFDTDDAWYQPTKELA